MISITSPSHPLVKHLMKLRQDRSYRYEQERVVIMGKKMIDEICSTHTPYTLLTTQDPPPSISCKKIYQVTEAILKKITGVQQPEGIIAEIPLPKESTLSKIRFLLALDEVTDPGNMGTLIRTALALNWEGVFLLNHCCDPFNDKAIRASKGAIFRLPFRSGTWDELNQIKEENNLQAVAADLEGTPLNTFQSSEKILLVLGNEAHGISEETRKHCAQVTIPICSAMESLNAAIAGGILMYKLHST